MIDNDQAAAWLRPRSADHANAFVEAVLVGLPSSITQSLTLAERLGSLRALPGQGNTLELFEALATLAAHDLGTVRAVEPHLDAIAILGQAGIDPGQGAWGVFAAEGAEPLIAAHNDSVWSLTGTKQWCSLAATLGHALVTARIGDDRGLFAVDLAAKGVTVQSGSWHARGLAEIPSEPVHFDGVAVTPVGPPGWYLSRPGFAWGGIGVAACWYGGAIGVARTVLAAARTRPDDAILLMHLGAIDESLQSARRALVEAAEAVDFGSDVRLLAKRVRATVAGACDNIIGRAGHALGPAPLAHDAEHAKRIADLTIYVRQHHAERDEISLGRSILESEVVPW